MRSGRLKVFASLPKYLEERRLYRRDGKDQLVKGAGQPSRRRTVSGEWHLADAHQAQTHSIPAFATDLSRQGDFPALWSSNVNLAVIS
jgi:hypothetical protein